MNKSSNFGLVVLALAVLALAGAVWFGVVPALQAIAESGSDCCCCCESSTPEAQVQVPEEVPTQATLLVAFPEGGTPIPPTDEDTPAEPSNPPVGPPVVTDVPTDVPTEEPTGEPPAPTDVPTEEHCNQGGGNGPEGCSPGNSDHNQPPNDEEGGGRGHAK